jgi:hypothetical protein
MIMKASGMRIASSESTGMQGKDALKTAYRSTFEEYSNRLDTLHRLIASGTPDSGRIETAIFEVERARVAHNCARDRLARDLLHPSLPPAARVNEVRIRETAQLLWELAGRPEGTAEYDWRRAEQLVEAAAASAS